MELRTLKYFLAVAKEENMSHAANTLHVVQPTLSKQIKSLEKELGTPLFTRQKGRLKLTPAGELLKKRSEDLIAMADKIENEFSVFDEVDSGDLYFGLAESAQIKYVAHEIKRFKKKYPNILYHVTSGDTDIVTEKLDKGLIDFAVLVGKPDPEKYDAIKLPSADRWGLIFLRDDPLALKKTITVEDLIDLPLFCSDQSWREDIPRWSKERFDELHLEGSFRLSYNGSIFTREGLGYLLTLDNLIDTSESSNLVFRPLEPALYSDLYFIWRKNQLQTPITQAFLEQIQENLKNPHRSEE